MPKLRKNKFRRNLQNYQEVLENSPKLWESFGEFSKTLRNNAKLEKEQVLEKSLKLSPKKNIPNAYFFV